jgi:hypothetical protein
MMVELLHSTSTHPEVGWRYRNDGKDGIDEIGIKRSQSPILTHQASAVIGRG